MTASLPAFSVLVADAMARRGLGLRELCRQAKLDPSFLSKVLAGKRNPPAEEEVLRRMAASLELNAVSLFIAAGRIPSEWNGLTTNPELVRRVDALVNSGFRAPQPPALKSPAPSSKPFNEELL